MSEEITEVEQTLRNFETLGYTYHVPIDEMRGLAKYVRGLEKVTNSMKETFSFFQEEKP